MPHQLERRVGIRDSDKYLRLDWAEDHRCGGRRGGALPRRLRHERPDGVRGSLWGSPERSENTSNE